ncbi:hypothetical protein [Anaerotruncus colihominis]|uniref:Uncharacterized protein n=4 Tax=Anaerotruncus colihominis TaxID=169435 RepID=A0A845SUF2_9FIRM|nr:hypothetical protein [Anaerotruncus colihominis]MCR2025459.1 hypothetical protein [Anaerotruncus colihominis]NDO37914.1 hypothetical protein [Anaerotruncus colihominis]
MKALIKKCVALALAAITALSLAAGIQAATTIYSVKIQKNSILIQNKGKTVETYDTKSTDLTLSQEYGKLLLSYKNAQNLSRDIALGTQSSLTIQGAASSLTLDSSLPTSMRLVLDTGSSVSSLKIASPGKITIRGKVDTLTVSSAARVTVSKGGVVTDATLTSSSAVLIAGTGAQVKNATVVKKSSVSGSGIGTVKVKGSDSDGRDDNTTTDGGLTIKTSTISARSGDTLRDLESDLNHYVKVYDRDGDRVDGKAEWVSSPSTKVKKTGSYQFDFYPDDDDYDNVRGTIKISVSGRGDDDDGDTTTGGLTIKTSTISARSGDTLRDLESDLNHYVKVYDRDGDRVDGKAEWVSSYSTKVTKSGSFKFDFYPDDDDYDNVRGTIKISVSGRGDDDDGDTTAGGLTIKTSTISARSGDTLRDLESDLNHYVKVYDRDGDRVDGKAEWVSSYSTKVTKSGSFKFDFYPDDDDYDDVRGTIKISVSGRGDDDDGDTTTGGLTIKTSTISARSGDTLRDLESDLNHYVKVYDRDGDRVDGKAEWVSSYSTKVTKSGSFKFDFYPDDDDYDDVRGSIRIEVSGSSSSSGKKVRLYVSPITVSSTSKRLRDLEDALEDSVKAYYDGSSVRGDVSWEDSASTQVKKTGTYQFVFKPDSSSYKTVTGEIKIIVDTDSDDGNNSAYGNDDYTLEIEDIHISSSTKRLGSLLSDLEDAVVARNDDGDKIDGEPYWVDSSNTRVRETGTYRFTFTPKSSRYDPVTAKIKIYVD